MRYLKMFKESNNFDKLKFFTEENLAYLLDNKEYKIVFRNADTNCYISLTKSNKFGQIRINWNDVKDYLIPFIEVLKDEYKIINFIPWKGSTGNIAFVVDKNDLSKYYHIEDLENFKLEFYQMIIKLDLN